MPKLQGVGHVALTVTDPKRSADFYNRLFDAQTVLTVEDEIGPLTICVSPAMMFGFRTHPSTGEADRFDPARVGLDHLGFHVADRQQLEAWQVRLDEQGVTNSGIIEDEKRPAPERQGSRQHCPGVLLHAPRGLTGDASRRAHQALKSR